MTDTIIGVLRKGIQSVNVVKKDRLIGYHFDAIGAESLSLAVDLAVMQTQKGIEIIDMLLKIGHRKR